MKLRPIGLLILAAVLAGACGGRREATDREPANEPEHTAEGEETPERVTLTAAAIAEAGIDTWQVKPVDLEHILVLTGSVGYDEDRLLQVASNVRGRVTSIPVDLGARVREGDALLVLESIELGKAREEYLREASALRVASRAYERARRLVAAQAISSGELQVREGEYLSRRAAAQGAERTLHLLGDSDEEIRRLSASIESDLGEHGGLAPCLTLRAPFAGRVVDRKVTPGSLVEALQPLVIVADLGSVWVFLQAYEKDLALVDTGLSVTIRTEAYPRESFSGRIDFVGSTVDSGTRTVRVRATVANRSERLKPGMFVKAQAEVPKPEAEVRPILVVPQSALQTIEGRSAVFVEVEPHVFARRFVEVGHSFEGVSEVLAGVRSGEVVVTEGSFVLKSEFAKASLAEEH